METFSIVKRKDEKQYEEYPTKQVIWKSMMRCGGGSWAESEVGGVELLYQIYNGKVPVAMIS